MFHNLLQNHEIVLSLITFMSVPLLTLLTILIKGYFSKSARVDMEQVGYIKQLREDVQTSKQDRKELNERVEYLNNALDVIKIRLKNRDEEYLKIFQDYTQLKAEHEVLFKNHEELKSNYDSTALELTQLKADIKKKAEEAAKSMQKI